MAGPATASAEALKVACGQRGGLATIGAALNLLHNSESLGPTTIQVSGQCRENVVIQGLDRLTLLAVNGASITDASGGTGDVVTILDSRSVTLTGFTINAGADGVTGANGVSCSDNSLCRLSGNVIQGAADGAGLIVGQQAQAITDGDLLQNNGVGLLVVSGSMVRASNLTARGNGQGVRLARGVFATLGGCVIENSADAGVVAFGNATLNLGNCTVRGSGSTGIRLRGGTYAVIFGDTVTANAGAGVVVSDLAMAEFSSSSVTGNGFTDVVCNPQFSATRGTGSIGGGTTNCVEP